MDEVIFRKIDDVYSELVADSDIITEINENFTFFVPGYRYMKAFIYGDWDGKIRLINSQNMIYTGLLDKVARLCYERGYAFKLKGFEYTSYTDEDMEDFIDKLNLPENRRPRDYQIKALNYCVNANRALILSPTGSGKSLISYLITEFYKTDTLIIVPRIGLVEQLYSDFESYGMRMSDVRKIRKAVDKSIKSRVVISTWQSLYRLPKSWFSRFKLIIGDEAHGFKANSLTNIMHMCTDAPYKFGVTGTLDDTKCHVNILQGLFGGIYTTATTRELIDAKFLADLEIYCIKFSYPQDECSLVNNSDNKVDFASEKNYIIDHKRRNKYIVKLALELKNNTLILFWAQRHGKALYNKIKEINPDKQVYLLYGKNPVEEREEVRRLMEQSKDCIVVASTGVFSVGTNVVAVDNIILAQPSKAKINILQSIGRGLRRSSEKTKMVLYDLADDFSYDGKLNYTMVHFLERLKLYKEQKFSYKILKVDL